MIGSLKGKVTGRYGDQIVVEVGGVGYEVTASTSLLEAAHAETALELVIYTDVRENAIQLFGFRSILEKQVFLLLKKVKGIGARSAQAIVSAMGAEGVLSAIGREDVAALSTVPGIGRKTAERVIVELRERVGELVREAGVAVGQSPTSPRGKRRGADFSAALAPLEIETEFSSETDAVLALEKLGFGPERARRAVSLAVQNLKDDGAVPQDAGDLLRAALARL